MENYVITIARAYGSGGCGIGTRLAKELGIKFYDKELLQIASDESGISSELFHRYDENLDSKWYRKPTINFGDVVSPRDKSFTSKSNLYNYQAKIIRWLANHESCVIIGRAANYILRNEPNVISVNIQAPEEVCIMSAMSRLKYSRADAEKYVKVTNQKRAEFYQAFTGHNWLDPDFYDLYVNSARLGEDRCVEMIKQCVRLKMKIDV